MEISRKIERDFSESVNTRNLFDYRTCACASKFSAFILHKRSRELSWWVHKLARWCATELSFIFSVWINLEL